MKNSTIKLHKLRLLILLIIITAICAAAIADVNDSNVGNKEVLSTLGQRMQKRVSVDFRDTPIDDVIRIMAEQSGVDIIKSPKVTGVVTAALTNVPLDEALNNILASQGYGYVASNNMIRILPREEMSEASETIVSEIYQINYADVAEVEAALKKFISPRGSLSSNPGTSNIMVADSESKMKTISDFIKKIDRITPQILVEARIYDITHQDTLDLGIEWMAGSQTTIGEDLGSNPTGNTYPYSIGTFRAPTGKTATATTGTLRLGFLNSSTDIDIRLRAEAENINAKLLANPRILVLDNEDAIFNIVREIPL